MRDRLAAAFAGVAVLLVALYAVPRAYATADLVREAERQQAARSAEIVAILLAEVDRMGGRADAGLLERVVGEGESIEYDAPEGPDVRVGGSGADSGDGDISVTRPVAGGGTVTVTRSGAMVQDRVAAAIMPLALLGAGLVAVSAVVSLVLARRLSRPYQERAKELDALLRREREFAASASHELRTPVTALRLKLEDLSLGPQTPLEGRVELGQALTELDRLAEAISLLLEAPPRQAAGRADHADLADAVRGVAGRLSPEPELVLPEAEVAVLLSRSQLCDLLARLLDEVSTTASGRLAVTVVDRGTHARVRVEGLPERPPIGTAERLAAALGARVVAGEGVVDLLLPNDHRDTPPGTGPG